MIVKTVCETDGSFNSTTPWRGPAPGCRPRPAPRGTQSGPARAAAAAAAGPDTSSPSAPGPQPRLPAPGSREDICFYCLPPIRQAWHPLSILHPDPMEIDNSRFSLDNTEQILHIYSVIISHNTKMCIIHIIYFPSPVFPLRVPPWPGWCVGAGVCPDLTMASSCSSTDSTLASGAESYSAARMTSNQ